MSEKPSDQDQDESTAVPAVGGKPAVKTAADHRRAKAAQKLRENLQRRKQQLRARRSGEADETTGLPAAKTTQGDD